MPSLIGIKDYGVSACTIFRCSVPIYHRFPLVFFANSNNWLWLRIIGLNIYRIKSKPKFLVKNVPYVFALRKRFFVRNGAKRHKTDCSTRLYATTGATRCPAFIPGILVDTLLRTASCGGENLVYRSNLSRRIAEMADPATFKPILPPLPATFSQSFSGVKDAPARGDHFPQIFWCKLPKLRKIIWFFFQKPIIRPNPIIKLLRIGWIHRGFRGRNQLSWGRVPWVKEVGDVSFRVFHGAITGPALADREKYPIADCERDNLDTAKYHNNQRQISWQTESPPGKATSVLQPS